jgi:hypothetical protein
MRTPLATCVVLLIATPPPVSAQLVDVAVPLQVVTAREVERLPTCGRALLDLVNLASAPALDVSKGEIRVPAGMNDASLLDHLDIRDGSVKVQPASGLLCFDDIAVLKAPLEVLHGDNVAGVINVVTRPPGRPSAGQAPAYQTGFYAEPLHIQGQMQAIRGPFGGRGSDTEIDVGGQPGLVLAKTADTLFFMLPPDLPHGWIDITLTETGARVAFRVSVLGLAMAVEQLTLMRGQSTKLEVSVFGPEQLPPNAWTAGDMSSTLDLQKVAQLFPGFRLPKPGEPGSIFLRVDNASRDTVSMSPSRNETFFIRLERANFAAGPYTYRGVVRSRRAGSFRIDALIVGFFAPVPGTLRGG